LKIVVYQPSALVCDRCDCHDSRRLGGLHGSQLDRRKKQRRQREMAEDIDTELKLEAVCGLPPPARCHDTGIIDEYVQGALPGEFGLGERAHRCQRCQIDDRDLDIGGRRFGSNRGNGTLGALRIATSKHDLCTLARQHTRRLISDAAVGAGNQYTFARLLSDIGDSPSLGDLHQRSRFACRFGSKTTTGKLVRARARAPIYLARPDTSGDPVGHGQGYL
jgi:hypothetical protein